MTHGPAKLLGGIDTLAVLVDMAVVQRNIDRFHRLAEPKSASDPEHLKLGQYQTRVGATALRLIAVC